MAKPRPMRLFEWNSMVEQFHSETDRGAAVLAGSFAEHALGTYLQHRVSSSGLAERLFGPVGPLSSFSQRIAVAFAFGQISRTQYADFELVRQVRNHFAHHPLEASFSSPEVNKLAVKMSIYSDKEAMLYHPEESRPRIAYLFTCALLCGNLLDKVEREQADHAAKVARRAK